MSCSPKRTHDTGSPTGSIPRSESSGTSLVSSSGTVTNSSPNVRGSTKRSWPPWVNVITTCVCFGAGSLVCALRSCPLIRRWMTSSSAVSSLNTRYFPRRSTPAILAPVSLVMNCFFGCRLTVRVPLTSTALMRLPTASRSRPRRIVSTSGSSGIVAFHGQLGAQPLPRRSRRRGLGLLLRPALALAQQLTAEPYVGIEALGVVRPVVGDRVPRQFGEPPGRQLLEPGLVVLPARTHARLRDAVAEQLHDQQARRVPSAIEIDRAQYRFERVGEDRRLLTPARAVLALPEEHGGAELELGGDFCEGRGAHDRR